MDGSGTSFGKTADNPWRTPVNEEQFIQLVENNQVIWVQKSDPWLEAVLRTLPGLSECPNPFSEYFLFKNKMGWECVPKGN